jgi:hypothetical protein
MLSPAAYRLTTSSLPMAEPRASPHNPKKVIRPDTAITGAQDATAATHPAARAGPAPSPDAAVEFSGSVT